MAVPWLYIFYYGSLVADLHAAADEHASSN